MLSIFHTNQRMQRWLKGKVVLIHKIGERKNYLDKTNLCSFVDIESKFAGVTAKKDDDDRKQQSYHSGVAMVTS